MMKEKCKYLKEHAEGNQSSEKGKNSIWNFYQRDQVKADTVSNSQAQISSYGLKEASLSLSGS